MTEPSPLAALLQTEWRALTYPVTRLVAWQDPLSAPWLLGGLGFVILSWLVSRLRRGGGRGPDLSRRRRRALLRVLFPARVFGHPSARLDYKLFVVNSIVVAGGVSLLLVGPGIWKDVVFRGLVAVFGQPVALTVVPQAIVIAGAGVACLLALDFGYWLAHYAMHRIPALWAFHKVHHSAEVMTPATEWRQHPVEFLLIPAVYMMTAGAVYGLVAWRFGEAVAGAGMGLQAVLLLAHLATFHHVRHSHIRIAFTGAWGRILHSPAHHQLHHSSDPAHFDCNFGFLLSIWDAMAGVLVMPTGRERLTLGIGPEGRTHDSVFAVYLRPFIEVAAMIRGRPAPP